MVASSARALCPKIDIAWSSPPKVGSHVSLRCCFEALVVAKLAVHCFLRWYLQPWCSGARRRYYGWFLSMPHLWASWLELFAFLWCWSLMRKLATFSISIFGKFMLANNMHGTLCPWTQCSVFGVKKSFDTKVQRCWHVSYAKCSLVSLSIGFCSFSRWVPDPVDASWNFGRGISRYKATQDTRRLQVSSNPTRGP